MKFEFNAAYKNDKSPLTKLVIGFDAIVDPNSSGDRNQIKTTLLNGNGLCIKAFKKPNLINRIAYTFFRKSKAQRSFEFANRLLKLGILTPMPIAYFEFKTNGLIDKTFYISEQLDCDLTYRELTTNFNYPDYDNILRAFTRFTHDLHENNILFLDHSPGNTLIKKNNDTYDFYLVDLNRMEFRNLTFHERISNFKRLTVHASMIATMSDEMAKISQHNYQEIYTKMWTETQKFQNNFRRRRHLKSKFKFW